MVASTLLFAIGRVLGVLELIVLAAGGLALVAGAAAFVAVRPPRLAVVRRVEPARPQAGGLGEVTVRIEGTSRARSSALWVADRVDGRALGERLLSPPRKGEVVVASYRLPALTRGLRRLGPLSARVVDPFGLVDRTTEVGEVTDVLVRPRVDDVRRCPTSGSDDLRSTSSRPPASRSLSGEDFMGLRVFQVGDDIRRVHWPSSARRNDLMVRQLETPGERQVTVLLDTTGTEGTFFEAAVSAAASVLSACSRAGLLVRLVTSDGTDSGFGHGAVHLESLLLRLALVSAGRDSVDGGGTAMVRRGAVVLMTAGAAVPRLPWRATAAAGADIDVTWVTFDPGTGVLASPLEPGGAAHPGIEPRVRMVSVSTPGGFVLAWSSAMARHRPAVAGGPRAGKGSP